MKSKPLPGIPGVLLANVSSRMRVGCKGPAAERWLTDQDIFTPQGANRFTLEARGLLVVRLATSEFLLEATLDTAATILAPVKRALDLAEVPAGVYPVLRRDFAIELRGPEAHDLFAQTCAIDLQSIERESTPTGGPIVLTSMIGVGVVIACCVTEEVRFTIWSDPSYRQYLWGHLTAIASDLSGGHRAFGIDVNRE